MKKLVGSQYIPQTHRSKEQKTKTNLFICIKIIYERDRFSVALYATEERSPEDEKLYAGQNRGGKKKK